jgi:hypothetical protein
MTVPSFTGILLIRASSGKVKIFGFTGTLIGFFGLEADHIAHSKLSGIPG